MAQFNCPICNQGFEQKSRFDRHMMTSHPEQAPSAADLEQALGEIQNLPEHVGYRQASGGGDIAGLIEVKAPARKGFEFAQYQGKNPHRYLRLEL